MSVWCSIEGCPAIATEQIMDKETMRMIDYCKRHYVMIKDTKAYEEMQK